MRKTLLPLAIEIMSRFLLKKFLFSIDKNTKRQKTYKNFHLPSVRNLFPLLLAHFFLSHLSIYGDIIEAIRIYHRIWRRLINHIWSTITKRGWNKRKNRCRNILIVILFENKALIADDTDNTGKFLLTPVSIQCIHQSFYCSL